VETVTEAKFDVSAVARELDRINRPKRLLLIGFGLLGLLAGVGGLWFILTAPSSSLSDRTFLFGALFLAIGFPIISIVCFWVGASFPRSPHTIAISPDGVRLLGGKGVHSDQALRWSDPRFRLTVYDFRPFGKTWEDHTTPRTLDFVALNLSRRLRFPLSSELAIRLIEEAKRHGLTVAGWEQNPVVPGPARRITFRATSVKR